MAGTSRTLLGAQKTPKMMLEFDIDQCKSECKDQYKSECKDQYKSECKDQYKSECKDQYKSECKEREAVVDSPRKRAHDPDCIKKLKSK